MQFTTGDPAVVETAMSGAIWIRFLVPPELGDSSGAAEHIMALIAVKEAVSRRIQAAEMRTGPLGPIPLYLGALAVLHGTAAGQVSREMKYLAAELAIVPEAKAQGKAKAGKSDVSCHPPGILTKPLQGGGSCSSEGAFWGLKAALPAKSSSGAAPATKAGEAKEKSARPRRALSDSPPPHVGAGAQGAARPGAPLGPTQARTTG